MRVGGVEVTVWKLDPRSSSFVGSRHGWVGFPSRARRPVVLRTLTEINMVARSSLVISHRQALVLSRSVCTARILPWGLDGRR
jgi:hypothetical protein